MVGLIDWGLQTYSEDQAVRYYTCVRGRAVFIRTPSCETMVQSTSSESLKDGYYQIISKNKTKQKKKNHKIMHNITD